MFLLGNFTAIFYFSFPTECSLHMDPWLLDYILAKLVTMPG